MGYVTGADAASSRMLAAKERYADLGETCGMASFSMRSAWCGWLSFGFSGDVEVSNADACREAGILVMGDDGEMSLSLSTAYCSSVLRDLCTDLSGWDGADGNASPITVFCDAEEHGEHVVTIETDRVIVRDAFDGEAPMCSVTRGDGGDYARDLTGCLIALRDALHGMPADEQEDVLGSLCLFCEVTEDGPNGEISVIDAGIGDVKALFDELGTVK